MPARTLGRSAVVEGAILGGGAHLCDHVRRHQGLAIGDQVTIGPEASLFPGVRVYPFKEIETGAQIHESHRRGDTGHDHALRPGRRRAAQRRPHPQRPWSGSPPLSGTALRRGDRVVASRSPADACRMIQRALIAGLTSTGVHVADLRISPAAGDRLRPQDTGPPGGHPRGSLEHRPRSPPVRVFEWPGNQMTSELQKEAPEVQRRGPRGLTFAEVGETTQPARVRESYAQDILDPLDVGEPHSTVAVDYGYSPAAFTLPLVLGPLGVEAIGVRGLHVELHVEASRTDRLDAEGPEDEREREGGRRVPVVDRDPGTDAVGSTRRRGRRGCPARSSRGRARGTSSPPPPRTSRGASCPAAEVL